MKLLTKLFFLAGETGEDGMAGLKESEGAKDFLEKLLDDYIYGTTTQAILGVALVIFLIIKNQIF